jgi:hypothetical protein
MKAVLTAVISIVLLMGAPFAFAQSGGLLSKHPQADYQSGYRHGLTDGKNSCIHPGADQDKCYEYHDYV